MNDRIIPTDSNYEVVTYKLLSNGEDITYQYAILSVNVNREVNRLPTARLILRDGSVTEETFEASDGNHFIPGQKIEIAVGYDGKEETIFQGIIIKHAIKADRYQDSRLIIDCKDVAIKLTIGRHSRYFSNVTDSEAIEQILETYSDFQKGKEISDSKISHPEIIQYHASDWDFILSRAEVNGLLVLAEDGILKVMPPPKPNEPTSLTLTYGSNMLEFEAEIDVRHQYKAVKAKAWDYSNQELIEVEATEPSINNPGNLSYDQLSKVIDLKEWELRHSGLVQDRELQKWADAQLLKSRLAKIQGRVKTKGHHKIRPNQLIKLQGLGDRFNGVAYVSGVRHEITQGLWYTHLQLGLTSEWFYQKTNVTEQPASGLIPGVHGLQIGVVEQLQNDPNEEDRILVKVPTIDQQAEGTWARIATLDAGENRGSFFRPEIGDEVILGFINDDPRDSVVLGMLNSRAKPAPLSATDENHQKGFFTRSQIKIVFDDDRQILSLETPDGNKITLSDDDKSITIEDQNGNQIQLGEGGINLKSPKDITLEAQGKMILQASQDMRLEGLNVDVNAQAQFKAKGTAGAEMSTGAIAILKGSSVMIN